jgi:hypothetical protein
MTNAIKRLTFYCIHRLINKLERYILLQKNTKCFHEISDMLFSLELSKVHRSRNIEFLTPRQILRLKRFTQRFNKWQMKPAHSNFALILECERRKIAYLIDSQADEDNKEINLADISIIRKRFNCYTFCLSNPSNPRVGKLKFSRSQNYCRQTMRNTHVSLDNTLIN